MKKLLILLTMALLISGCRFVESFKEGYADGVNEAQGSAASVPNSLSISDDQIYTFPAGIWAVGDEIPPGVYYISCPLGESVLVELYEGRGSIGFSAIDRREDVSERDEQLSTLLLMDGQELHISEITTVVSFIPCEDIYPEDSEDSTQITDFDTSSFER